MKIDIQLSELYGEKFPAPRYATPGSAGLDLRADIERKITIWPGDTELISVGVKLNIADPGYAGLLLPKSGLGHKHGVVLGNLIGLMDSDYQGWYMVSVWNRNREKVIAIDRGDEIAQLVIVPVAQALFNVVDEFEANTERGSGGFGSTGE